LDIIDATLAIFEPPSAVETLTLSLQNVRFARPFVVPKTVATLGLTLSNTRMSCGGAMQPLLPHCRRLGLAIAQPTRDMVRWIQHTLLPACPAVNDLRWDAR
jgi:hypothetical protein